MSLTPTNALLSISVNGGAATPQAANARFSATAGSTLGFSLQSTNLVASWEVLIRSDDTAIDGRVLTWTQGRQNLLTLTLPAASVNITYTSIVADGYTSSASISGTIAAVSAGGGSSTTTTLSYTQPAVGGTVVVTIGTTSSAVQWGTATVAGGGFYQVNAISGFTVTLLNTASAVNAAPGTGIPPGSVVTFGGPDAQLSSTAVGESQTRALTSGAMTPAGFMQTQPARTNGAKADGTDAWTAMQRSVAQACAATAHRNVHVQAGAETLASTGAHGTYLVHQPVFVYDALGTNTSGLKWSGASRVTRDYYDDDRVAIRGPVNNEATFPFWEGPAVVFGGSQNEPAFAARQFGSGGTINYAIFNNPTPFALEAFHFINWSEAASGTCSLDGLAAFCAECFFRLPSSPASNDFAHIWYCGYQNITIGGNELTLDVAVFNTGASLVWYLYVTTDQGTATGQSVSTVSLNTDYYVKFSFDGAGATAKLFVGAAGAGSTTAVISLALPGAGTRHLAQTHKYSQFVTGPPPYASYPAFGSTLSHAIDGIQYGSIRFRTVADNSTTIQTSELAVDTSSNCTMMLVNFGSANRSSTRTAIPEVPGGYLGWIVGQTNISNGWQARLLAGNDVWIHWKGTFSGRSDWMEIEDTIFGAAYGQGAYVFSCLYAKFRNCRFIGRQMGLMLTAFSYLTDFDDKCWFEVNNAYNASLNVINASLVISNTEMVTDQRSLMRGGTWAIIVGSASELHQVGSYVSPSTLAPRRGVITGMGCYSISGDDWHYYDESGQLSTDGTICLHQVSTFDVRALAAQSNNSAQVLLSLENGPAAIMGQRIRIKGIVNNFGTLAKRLAGEPSPPVYTDISTYPYNGNVLAPFPAATPVHLIDAEHEFQNVVMNVHTTTPTMSWQQFTYGSWTIITDASYPGGAMTMTLPVAAGDILARFANTVNGVDIAGGYGGGYTRRVFNKSAVDITFGTGSLQNYVGTVSVVATNAVVTGSGTTFLWTCYTGQTITVNATTATILTVDSDTQITLTAGWGGGSASGATLFTTGKTFTVHAGKSLLVQTRNGRDWYAIGPET